MNSSNICFFFVNIYFILSIINGEGIHNIYFDPHTSLSPSKHDGVVIIETTTGTKSTICMNYDHDINNAKVICRMMGYDVSVSNIVSTVLITSAVSHFSNETHYEGLTCLGNELSLLDCPGFVYSKNTKFRCQNNNQDMHVMCMGQFLLDTKTIQPSSSDCKVSGNRIASLSNGSKGLLKIRNGTDEFTVCGINRNLGTNEALLFCNALLCQNSSYARIVEGYTQTGAPIGGFKNMRCPINARSLSDCVNVYPHDNEGCTPNDNIGVICSLDPFVADPVPEVQCDGTSLSLFWNKSVHRDVDRHFVSIMDNDKICDNVIVDDSVKLKVNYADCGMQTSGDNETVVYTFQAKRIYPKFQNIILKEDQLYNVACIIARNETTSDISFEVNSSASLQTISNDFHIPNSMIISLDSKFHTEVSNIKNVKLGTEIFVKVTLTKPPSQLVPFLEHCSIESETSSEQLISNKCPVRSDVVISPLDKVTVMFSFKSFAIGSLEYPTRIKCITSMCGQNSIGCIPTCQQLPHLVSY